MINSEFSLTDAQAVSLEDLERAENDLNRERAEFKQAKGRLLSLRVPAAELSKPLAQQQITSRFELRSPLTGTVTNCRPCFGHAVVYRRQSRPFAGRRGCV